MESECIMKKNKALLVSALLSIALAVPLTACSNPAPTTTETTTETVAEDVSGEVTDTVAEEERTLESYAIRAMKQAQEAADSVMALTHTLSENLLNENKDNLLSVAAIFNLLQDYSYAQIDSIIQTLDPKVREMEDMRQLESSIKVRLVTGEGKPFKDFTIMQPDGKAVSLSDFAGKGKYILLDFWASWCGPCKREIPAIKAAYDKFHGPDFDIVSVAVWEQSVSASIDTAKAYGIQWNHILDAKEVPTKLYGVDGIPHLILIGPDGTILKRGLRGEEISAEIGKYIAPVK